MQFSIVPPVEGVRAVWPKAEPFIQKGLSRTGADAYYLPLDVYHDLISRPAVNSLWVLHDGTELGGALVTVLESFPRMLACRVWIGGGLGLLKHIDLVNARLEEYARRAGCKRMIGGGRKGWVRAAHYRYQGAVLIKDL
jgi:hypothetical protein